LAVAGVSVDRPTDAVIAGNKAAMLKNLKAYGKLILILTPLLL